MRRRDPNLRAVFDSDRGRLETGEAAETPVDRDRVARLRLETSGRRGKAVTVLYDLPLDAEETKALAQELKRACSSGGSLKDGRIEIQGDHRAAVEAVMKKRGLSVKRSGG
ncbi:MAG: stress response translation initiation inhibitor YciH [Planctomycetota bacterium]